MEEGSIEKNMTPKLIRDLGMRYPTEKSTRKYRYGLYECQYCGQEFEAQIGNVRRQPHTSCGCRAGNPTHGLRNNKFYETWNAMIRRCNNPKHKSYPNYGGRGITVCDEWLDVTNFAAWCESTHPNMEGYTLDRVDNDKGYSPDNCTWADKTTQCLNQRISKRNTSGVVGVSYNNRGEVWTAYISVNNTKKHIGSFKTIEEAVLARDNYITQNNLPHKLSTDYKR